MSEYSWLAEEEEWSEGGAVHRGVPNERIGEDPDEVDGTYGQNG